MVCTYDVYRVLYARTIRTIFLILFVFGHRHCCWTAFSFGWPNKCQDEKRFTKWYLNVWSEQPTFTFPIINRSRFIGVPVFVPGY